MTDKKLHPLVIVEGPDCAGKTTLIQELRKKLNRGPYEVVHHGPYPRITEAQLPRLYVEGLFPLLRGETGMIMDRSWLSEHFYGRVFRDGKDRIGTVHARHLDRIALRHGAVVVLCLPPWETVKAGWLERKGANAEAEYLDRIEQLQQVYEYYCQAVAARYTSLPVVRYDYTIHGHRVQDLADRVQRASTRPHPEWYVRSAGSLDGRVVLVGERPSEVTDRDTLWQFPFCSFGGGSSAWLTGQLIEGRIAETDLLWVNASDSLIWLKEQWSRPVVALGQEAALKLTRDGIPHLVVSHPQHHKRFKSAEPYPLIPLLQQLIKE